MDKDILEQFGWNGRWQDLFEAIGEHGSTPGRILSSNRERYAVRTAGGVVNAVLSGNLRRSLRPSDDAMPVTGDWVALCFTDTPSDGTIEYILPRKNALKRRKPGKAVREQVIAANIDTVFILMGMDRDFNLNRLERYNIILKASEADGVVVLTKSDLARDVPLNIALVSSAVPGLPVHAVCAPTGRGVEELGKYCVSGRTVVLIGSSGCGKSTLINALLGYEARATCSVREHDGRGKHTTTDRVFLPLPGGGLIMDNPGMREIQLWGDGESVSAAYDDIDRLAGECKFNDCRHQGEPGCAVLAALGNNEIPYERYNNYLAYREELERSGKMLKVRRRARDKQISRFVRNARKYGKRGEYS